MLTLARSPNDKFAGNFETNETRYATFIMAEILSEDGSAPIRCRIANISAGGLMAIVPAGQAISGAVEVFVRHAGTLAGEVAWASKGEIGVRFYEAIDPLKLLADRAESALRPAREACRFVEQSRSKLERGGWSSATDGLEVPLMKH